MKIEFDPEKDATNIAKHGVSLTEAVCLDWESMVSAVDDRHEYGETRMEGLALNGDRVFCVVFTDRGDTRRVISLRKANAREVKRYARQI